MNKILKEYIMQNTPQQSEDDSIIEIIADEVNEALNNLPEIKLASEVLSEDELKELFAPLAKQVVMSVHGQIGQKIKGMVLAEIAPQITPDQYAAILGRLDGLSDKEMRAVLLQLLRADEELVDLELSDKAPDDILDTIGEPEEEE